MRITVRRAEEGDYDGIAGLFVSTVLSVNSEDYMPSQLEAWIAGNEEGEVWKQKLDGHIVLVALFDDVFAGFGDITTGGHLDHLFVHPDFPEMGIGTLLSDSLERSVEAEVITTDASITAMPFFRKRGYTIVSKQQARRNGVLLENYRMEKQKN